MKKKIIDIDDLSNIIFQAMQWSEHEWAFEAAEKEQEFFDKLPDYQEPIIIIPAGVK
jgi:hypothetical protein